MPQCNYRMYPQASRFYEKLFIKYFFKRFFGASIIFTLNMWYLKISSIHISMGTRNTIHWADQLSDSLISAFNHPIHVGMYMYNPMHLRGRTRCRLLQQWNDKSNKNKSNKNKKKHIQIVDGKNTTSTTT